MNVIHAKTPDRVDARAEDAALLLRISHGDRDAMRQLYHAYFRRLMRFLSRTVRDPRLAEEVVNDTMLVVWQHAADFRAESRPSTWIFGIAYRRALKALDRADAVARHDRQGAQVAAADVEAFLDRTERDEWIQAGLASLSLEHRLTLELAYFVGMSCDEIAEVTECPVGTVKTRMFYARQQLRIALEALAAPDAGAGPGGDR